MQIAMIRKVCASVILGAAVLFAADVWAATYTWNAAISSGNWDDAANWLVNGETATSYPQEASDIAIFAANTTATVTRTTEQSISQLDLSAANISLKFVQGEGVERDAAKLTVTTLTISGENLDFTLDGVYVKTESKPMMGSAGKLSILGGSYFYSGVFYNQPFASGKMPGNEKGGDIYIAGGSVAEMVGLHMQNGLLEIDNSTYLSHYGFRFWKDMSQTTIRFKGKNAVCKMVRATNGDNKGKVLFQESGYNVHFEFVVPEGGFAQTPIQGGTTESEFLTASGPVTGAIAFDVLAESPAKIAAETLTVNLIVWPQYLKNAAFSASVNLPQASDAFAWTTTMLAAYLKGSFITSTPNVEESTWKGIDLSFEASENEREIFVAYGATDAGADKTAWNKVVSLGTIAANQVAYNYLFTQTADATWGSDNFQFMRFYIVEDGVEMWSDVTGYSSAPKFKDVPTATVVSYNEITIDGEMADYPGETCTLKVLTGESVDSLTTEWTDESWVLTKSADNQKFSLTLCEMDAAQARLEPSTTYCIVIVATSDGVETRSDTIFAKTKSNVVTYRWSGAGEDGAWENSANWTCEPSGYLDYPSLANAIVAFPKGAKATIVLDKNRTIAEFWVASNVEVTFRKADDAATTPTLTVAKVVNLSGENSVFTLDGVNFTRTPQNSEWALGANSTWRVINGAKVTCENAGTGDIFSNRGGRLIVEDSTFTCARNVMSLGALTYVKNSTFTAIGQTRWNSTDADKPDTIRIEGANACYKMGLDNWEWFSAATAGAVLKLEFVVPAGGWAVAPVRSDGAPTRKFGNEGVTGKINVNLIADAGCKERVTTPLIKWSNAGIQKSVFTLLPQEKKVPSLLWKDAADPKAAESTSATPPYLYGFLPNSSGLVIRVR